MNTKELLSSIRIILLGLVLAIGIQYIYAWTSPPGAAPVCPTGYAGCDAPVNVGSSAQVKLGSLSVNGSTMAQNAIGLTAWGQSVFNTGGVGNSAIQIIDGNQGAGKVLTSDANGNGTWQTSTGVSSSTSLNYDNQYASPTNNQNNADDTVNCPTGEVVTGIRLVSENGGNNINDYVNCSSIKN